MVEGSLWVYGRTDLTDYYRGALTLRQVYVRLLSLPAKAPVSVLLAEEQQKAEERRRAVEVESYTDELKRRWGNGD